MFYYCKEHHGQCETWDFVKNNWQYVDKEKEPEMLELNINDIADLIKEPWRMTYTKFSKNVIENTLAPFPESKIHGNKYYTKEGIMRYFIKKYNLQ